MGELTHLDGSESFDDQERPLSYRWIIQGAPEGSIASLSADDVARPSVVPDLPGTYVLSLRVTAGELTSPEDTTVVTVVADHPAPTNRPPTASILVDGGNGQNPVIGLDGSASADPEGMPLTYAWAFEARPQGSQSTISAPTERKTVFTPDIPGVYIVRLIVRDDEQASVPVREVIRFQNRTPIANAGPDSSVVMGTPVVLDGSASVDPDGDRLTYAWEVKGQPADSVIQLASPGVVRPAFTPTRPGRYVFELRVSDGYAWSDPDTITIVVRHPDDKEFVVELPSLVIDAEYSRARDVLVTVSADPRSLDIHDLKNGRRTRVALTLVPTSVSLSLDGRHAAVGHDAWISYVDLESAKTEQMLRIDTKVYDVVLAPNGFIYAMPVGTTWNRLYGVEIVSGAQVMSSGILVMAGSPIRLHPDGTFMYGADRGLWPSDLEKYEISGGAPRVLYDSPYHGEYEPCGGLWFADDGTRIFSECGNVFSSSAEKMLDMKYKGSLEGVRAVIATDHSSSAGLVAAVPAKYPREPGAAEVRLFGHEFLERKQTIQLPDVRVDGTNQHVSGQFVFFDREGITLYVLATAPGNQMPSKSYLMAFHL